jgi:hypothetical protein
MPAAIKDVVVSYDRRGGTSFVILVAARFDVVGN